MTIDELIELAEDARQDLGGDAHGSPTGPATLSAPHSPA